MSCTSSCYTRVDAGCQIKADVHPDEIVFYLGGHDELVLVFDPDALDQFLAFAPTALRAARQQEAKRDKGEEWGPITTLVAA
jgi:hypothetical protein